MGPTRGSNGSIWVYNEPSMPPMGQLGAPTGQVGAPMSQLGAPMNQLKAAMGQLGASAGPLGAPNYQYRALMGL